MNEACSRVETCNISTIHPTTVRLLHVAFYTSLEPRICQLSERVLCLEFYGADDGELFLGCGANTNTHLMLLSPAGHCLQFALSQRCVQEQCSHLSVIS